MAYLLYQGHGSLRLRTDDGAVVYVDPFAGEGYDQEADLILVTHQHGDHNRIDRAAKKEGCRLIQNMDALADGRYQSFEVCGIRIEAVPAENPNHDRSCCVGYIVEADGVRCYFSGDTSKIPEMADYKARHLDYAFFPTDGIYNMGPEEASECALLVGAVHSVPIHTKPEALFDEETAGRFQAPGRLILHPGEEILLQKSVD